MILHDKSHTDHVDASVLNHVLQRFKDRNAFFSETFTLPADMPPLDCGLYGPAMGDKPVGEDSVHYGHRGSRPAPSRLVDLPKRKTRTCTVIAGPFDGKPCVLYTVYGGPQAPREVADVPETDNEGRAASARFWSEHALAKE